MAAILKSTSPFSIPAARTACSETSVRTPSSSSASRSKERSCPHDWPSHQCARSTRWPSGRTDRYVASAPRRAPERGATWEIRDREFRVGAHEGDRRGLVDSELSGKRSPPIAHRCSRGRSGPVMSAQHMAAALSVDEAR